MRWLYPVFIIGVGAKLPAEGVSTEILDDTGCGCFDENVWVVWFVAAAPFAAIRISSILLTPRDVIAATGTVHRRHLKPATVLLIYLHDL